VVVHNSNLDHLLPSSLNRGSLRCRMRTLVDFDYS